MNAPETFISERIVPDPESFDTAAPALGEPAVPRRFSWRGKTYEVRDVLARWREADADRTHGSGALYARKHWFHVRVDDGSEMKVYFERQPGSGRNAKARWWLYTLRAAAEADS